SLAAHLIYNSSGTPAGLAGSFRDITKRKRAEEALHKTEVKYRQLAETAHDIIVTVDLNFKITYVNKAANNFTGGIDPVGMSLLEFTPPHLHPLQEAMMQKRREGFSDMLAFEWEIIPPSGEIAIFDIRATLLTENGKPSGVMFVVREITEHKKAENALKENEAKYRTLIETTNTGFVIVNKDGFVLDANPEYVRLTGHARLSEIIGRSIIEWTSDYEKEKNAAAIGICFQKGYVRNLEIDYVDSKGNVTPIEINATCIETEGMTQILTLCRDITERKQAENSLHESEERFRSMVQSLSDMIFIVDRNGQLTYESPSVSRMLGYQPGYFMGKSPFTHIHPDDLDQVLKDMDEVFRLVNAGIPTEFRHRKADGTWAYLEALGSNELESPGIQGIILTVRDISERKRVEQALREREILFRGTFEQAAVGMAHVSLKGLFIRVNQKFCDIVGYGREEMLTLTFQEITYPDDLGKDLNYVQQVLENLIDTYSLEKRYIRKDGLLIWANLTPMISTMCWGCWWDTRSCFGKSCLRAIC
ncbi:MAG: PAS domain S-box protein, partial [Deltaproteobacteria bacterium]|nr:PAS domain S-box protein [Deltaproteobacteria bacterium]